MARVIDRTKTPGGWAQIKPGDLVELRGKRTPGRETVRVVDVLAADLNGIGVVDENGDTFRRWYYDARILVEPTDPR